MADLDDTSPMPFGKHKGVPMSEVPARYLNWLWTDGKSAEVGKCPVADYIHNNIAALVVEYPDGDWEQ